MNQITAWLPVFVGIILFIAWLIRLESLGKQNKESVNRLETIDEEQWAVVTKTNDSLGRIDKNLALVKQSVEHSAASSSSLALDFKDQSKITVASFERLFERLEKMEVRVAEHDVRLKGHAD